MNATEKKLREENRKLKKERKADKKYLARLEQLYEYMCRNSWQIGGSIITPSSKELRTVGRSLLQMHAHRKRKEKEDTP